MKTNSSRIKAIAKEVNAHREKNRELRVRFQQMNVDLEESRPIDFSFLAWTQRDAAMLGSSLCELGFMIKLLAPAATEKEPERWSIEAAAKFSLTDALGNELAEVLVKLATSRNAFFDGWGATVEHD